jgi:hypothetical protein
MMLRDTRTSAEGRTMADGLWDSDEVIAQVLALAGQPFSAAAGIDFGSYYPVVDGQGLLTGEVDDWQAGLADTVLVDVAADGTLSHHPGACAALVDTDIARALRLVPCPGCDCDECAAYDADDDEDAN